MLGGEVLGELSDRHPTRVELVFRHEDVDAVRLALDMVVDPAQLRLERFRRERAAAQHTETTGPADRGDDVAAMAEREEGEVDTDQITDDVHAGQHDSPTGQAWPST